FCWRTPHPPRLPLFPYPTLFRSASQLRDFRHRHGLTAEGEEPETDVDLRDEIEAEIEAELGEPEPEEEEGATDEGEGDDAADNGDRKSTRLNSSHDQISYAVFCL